MRILTTKEFCAVYKIDDQHLFKLHKQGLVIRFGVKRSARWYDPGTEIMDRLKDPHTFLENARIITVSDLAVFLNTTRYQLMIYAHKRKLECSTVNGQLKFSVADVRKILGSRLFKFITADRMARIIRDMLRDELMPAHEKKVELLDQLAAKLETQLWAKKRAIIARKKQLAEVEKELKWFTDRFMDLDALVELAAANRPASTIKPRPQPQKSLCISPTPDPSASGQ